MDAVRGRLIAIPVGLAFIACAVAAIPAACGKDLFIARDADSSDADADAEGGEAGGPDGAPPPVCVITCGGLGGRCGAIEACNAKVTCGECTKPASCVDGTCSCTPVSTCDSLQAKCGSFPDGCDKTL